MTETDHPWVVRALRQRERCWQQGWEVSNRLHTAEIRLDARERGAGGQERLLELLVRKQRASAVEPP